MFRIDLNCDLGEGAGADELIIPHITSANIACAFHAGSPGEMARTIALCKKYGVSAGAHPGYPDRENFGRTPMKLSAEEVYNITLYQLGALGAQAMAQGVRLSHIKAHGALYNQAAKDISLARAIANAAADYDGELLFFALSGSLMEVAAAQAGLKCVSEVFADRAYEADGSLRNRSLPGAVIEDEALAVARVVRMVAESRVKAFGGEDISINAGTVCVHGDGKKAVEFVKTLREAFAENGIAAAAPGAVV